MYDDLPEPFDKLPPHTAPLELRTRVLTAVEAQLRRCVKPRWERALEWSVAASFVLGVGLNADTIVHGARGLASLQARETNEDRRNSQVVQQSAELEGELVFPRSGTFDEDYAKLLARLSEPSAG